MCHKRGANSLHHNSNTNRRAHHSRKCNTLNRSVLLSRVENLNVKNAHLKASHIVKSGEGTDLRRYGKLCMATFKAGST